MLFSEAMPLPTHEKMDETIALRCKEQLALGEENIPTVSTKSWTKNSEDCVRLLVGNALRGTPRLERYRFPVDKNCVAGMKFFKRTGRAANR